MNNIKEFNFIKQIERTAKRDAYETAIMYIEKFGHEYGLKILREKADSHSVYLDTLPFSYDYATQTLKAKGDVPDGRLVMQAVGNLADSILSKDEKND
jgi:hypothetical protein